jgi:hypothetical protein
VESLVSGQEYPCIISELTTVEICSVFAHNVRTRAILPADFDLLQRRFFSDLKAGRFRVVIVESFHFRAARDLILKHGPSHSLRSLDAIQLAVAMHLKETSGCETLIAADVRLCAVAAVEGFNVLNPGVRPPVS